MINTISLFCFTLTFIMGNSVTPVQCHEEPAVLEQDKFCFFAYSALTKSANIQEVYPRAERVGVARLPYHRLDFNYYDEKAKGSLSTTVPDCGYEVWGVIYTIPTQDVDAAVSKGKLAGNERLSHFHFVPKIIQTYSNGNLINLKCNAFEQIDLPEKLIYGLPLPEDRRPSQQTLNRMIDAYNDAGLPRKYLEEISQLPTRDQNVIETDLVQNQNSQQSPVVNTPDSVVVASAQNP